MATLIQDNEQVNALNEINAMLKEVKTLNDRLLSKETYVIEAPSVESDTAQSKPGRKISTATSRTIRIDDSLASKIASVLRVQRDRRVKDILNKSTKFRIALSDADIALISDEALTAK